MELRLNNEQIARQKLDHNHQNPVKAGIVRRAEHYVYSSGIDYEGENGLLEIEMIF